MTRPQHADPPSDPEQHTDAVEHRRVRFSGRVQGVGFRATCHAEVRHVGELTGWVRNEPDGDVLLHLQGERERVERALDRIRLRFPDHIEREDSDELPVDAGLRAFSIRH